MDVAQPARELITSTGHYPVPSAVHREELIADRSRFLCTVDRAETVAQAQSLVRAVSAEFPGATHHCWAYVVGAPGSTSHIGMSDDGEPHGTAGRPMLTVLLHSGIGEIAAVVTRWYGGTKLGTGGLARAYGGAVQQALVSLPTQMRIDAVGLRASVEYGAITQVQQLIAALDISVITEHYAEAVTYEVEVPREHVEQFRQRLADATRGQAVVQFRDEPPTD